MIDQLDLHKLRLMAANLPFFAVVIDRDLTFLWANRIDPTLKVDDVIGAKVVDFTHDDDRQALMDAAGAAFRTGDPTRYESRGRVGGGWRWFETQVIPFHDEKTDAPMALLLSRDATERHEAHAQLEDQAQRLAIALQAADIGMWEWDLVNDQVRMSTVLQGARPGPVVSDPLPFEEFAQAVHPDSRDEFNATAARVRDHGEHTASCEMRVAGDEDRWVISRGVVAERADDGSPVRVIGTTVDITENRRAHEAQLRLREQLQQAQKMESIGQLAGGIAHDFNNLLQVVVGHLSMLKQRVETAPIGPEVVEDVVAIERAVRRATKLTRRLLTFARRQPHHPSSLRLDKLVEQSLHMLERVIPENLSIRTQLGDQKPLVRADSMQVEQVLMNLCVNARDEMPDGGEIVLSIEPRELELDDSAPAGSYWGIVVSDNGPGFSEESRNRATEPFFTTKEPGRGTGLGLSVVHGIVEQHDGFLEIANRPDGGAQVIAFFPEAKEEEAGLKTPDPSAPRSGSVDGLRILVAEDDDALRGLVVQFLTRVGAEVLAVSDGDRASEAARGSDRLDIALLDVVMPGRSGYEVAADLARERPDLPVVLMSGYAEPIVSHDRLTDEFIHLHKPFAMTEMVNALLEAIGDR